MQELLYLTHRIPYPPNKGDKIRSYHLLKFLTQHFRVHLGTFVDDPGDKQHIAHVKSLCGKCHFAELNPRTAKLRSLSGLLSGEPLTLVYYRDPELKAWVDTLLAQGDISHIVVFSSAMAQYVISSRPATRIMDFVDVDSDKWRLYAPAKVWPLSWLYRRESSLLLDFERRVAREFDASLFVSATEAALFKTLAPESAAKISYFNNGVDAAFFNPATRHSNPYHDDDEVMVFTGAMDYWPNVDAVVWFAHEILPHILAQRPRAVFYIVGGKPSPAVRNLSALRGVRVTGTVADVRPYLQHARVAVAPLRIARGVQNKVLEAMAMAKPVVVTPQALEGITARTNEEVLLASDSLEFSATVIPLLAASPHENKIGSAARARVLADYNWEQNLHRVSQFLHQPPAHAAQGGKFIYKETQA